MKVIDTEEKLLRAMKEAKGFKEYVYKPSSSIKEDLIFKDILFDDIEKFKFVAGVREFNNVIFYNCTIRGEDITENGTYAVCLCLSSSNTFKFIGCSITDVIVYFFGKTKMRSSESNIQFYCSTLNSILKIVFFNEVSIVNSSISEIKIDDRSFCNDMCSGRNKIILLNSSVEEILFEDSPRKFYHSTISDNSLLFRNISIGKVVLNSHVYQLEYLNSSSDTLKSLMDPGIIELQLGCQIRYSNFSNCDLSHCKFSEDSHGFFRCDVSNMNLKNMKIGKSSKNRLGTFSLWMVECSGVDTVTYNEDLFFMENEGNTSKIMKRGDV